MPIKWDVDGEDYDLIHQVVDRTMKLADKLKVIYPRMDAEMDLIACHVNGCPLRLADLLKAKDVEFVHDIFGIRRNLNRETGKLERCFLPRYAQPSKSKVR